MKISNHQLRRKCSEGQGESLIYGREVWESVHGDTQHHFIDEEIKTQRMSRVFWFVLLLLLFFFQKERKMLAFLVKLSFEILTLRKSQLGLQLAWECLLF